LTEQDGRMLDIIELPEPDLSLPRGLLHHSGRCVVGQAEEIIRIARSSRSDPIVA
jgi:hypothetical protein